MTNSEFRHLVNKYGANISEEDEALYCRDAYKCGWDLPSDKYQAYIELNARVEDYCHSCFPNMEIGKREKLIYSLTQCLAFEYELIERPDEKDVSYPGVGIIAESVLDEARSATMGSKPDFDTLIKPVCSNPDTGFKMSFDTIRQAAEWTINNDDGEVPHPFGSVKASKYSTYSWEGLPKHVQNSIMNNILNAACKKETRADLEDRFRDSGYGLVWELDDPSEIESEDIRCSYEEGHGSKEDRGQIKVKIAAEKAEKAKKIKIEKVEFVNKNKDWAISKLKSFQGKDGKTIFDSAECEPTYGYPLYGIYGNFNGNFDKRIKSVQTKLDAKMAAKGKKAKSLVKYFDYLNDVAPDLGLKLDDSGWLTERLIPTEDMLQINESWPRPKYIPFKAPSKATIDYKDTVSFTGKDGKTLEASYEVPVTVYYTEDGTEYDSYDDTKLSVNVSDDMKPYLPEITEKIKELLEDDPDVSTNICIAGDEHVAGLHDRHDWAYEDAIEAWQDSLRDEEDK